MQCLKIAQEILKQRDYHTSNPKHYIIFPGFYSFADLSL